MQICFVHRRYRVLLRHGASIALSFLFWACSTAPQPRIESPKERIQREVVLGGELSRQLEAELKIRREPQVSAFISEIGRNLLASAPDLRDSPVSVKVINDRDGKWRNYSLPGIHIYLSASLLRKTQFENELAAMVAIELGHVHSRSVIEQLRRFQSDEVMQKKVTASESDSLPDLAKKTTPADFFGPTGIFAYPEESILAATASAVELMYAAGYDPRGMVALLMRYQAEQAASPYDTGTLTKLIDQTREIIAQRAPLRNPIVRSDKFLAIQKRMQRL